MFVLKNIYINLIATDGISISSMNGITYEKLYWLWSVGIDVDILTNTFKAVMNKNNNTENTEFDLWGKFQYSMFLYTQYTTLHYRA